MNNRYGLDVSYFEKWISRALRDISNYKPSELARELARMSRTADSEVMKEPEFSDNDKLTERVKVLEADLTMCKKYFEAVELNDLLPYNPGYLLAKTSNTLKAGE